MLAGHARWPYQGTPVPHHDTAHKILRQHAAALCRSCPSTSPKEAFEQVMHGTDYKQASCACVPLDVSGLSIREEGVEPNALDRSLGPAGFEEVKRFLSDSVLPIELGAGGWRPALSRKLHGCRFAAVSSQHV